MAVLDLDHFKQVNDLHGHPVGDEVLREAGQRLSAVVREGEVLARVGGEEFAWILTGLGEEGAFAAIERARRVIGDTPFPHAGTVTMSAGVAELEPLEVAGDLYTRADQALYRAKQNGRNQTIRHSEPDGTGAERRLEVLTPRARAGPGGAGRAAAGRIARFTYSAPPATTALRTNAGGTAENPYWRRIESGRSAIVMKLTVSSRGRAPHGTGGSRTISRARRRAQSVTYRRSPVSMVRRYASRSSSVSGISASRRPNRRPITL